MRLPATPNWEEYGVSFDTVLAIYDKVLVAVLDNNGKNLQSSLLELANLNGMSKWQASMALHAMSPNAKTRRGCHPFHMEYALGLRMLQESKDDAYQHYIASILLHVPDKNVLDTCQLFIEGILGVDLTVDLKSRQVQLLPPSIANPRQNEAIAQDKQRQAASAQRQADFDKTQADKAKATEAEKQRKAKAQQGKQPVKA